MKKWMCILLLISVNVFGQTWSLDQNRAKVLQYVDPTGFWLFERNTGFYSDSTWYRDFQAGDTILSKFYLIAPWNWMWIQIEDTGVDSINMIANLYQSPFDKDTTIALTSRLMFHDGSADSTSSAVSVINTTGIWWCDFGNIDVFTGERYFQIEFIARTGHSIDTGVKFRVYVTQDLHTGKQ